MAKAAANTRLGALKGLGPKSEQWLNAIGLYTRSDLEKIGPVEAFVRLGREGHIKPSLNFLYAMVGALADRHWTRVAREEKTRLLMELEGYKELEALLKNKGRH